MNCCVCVLHSNGYVVVCYNMRVSLFMGKVSIKCETFVSLKVFPIKFGDIRAKNYPYEKGSQVNL